MTRKAPTNIAASIRARLHNHARSQGDDFQRVLTRYAIERLLVRLSRTQATQDYILKGAMLFATWPTQAHRPTIDLDLLGQGDPHSTAIQNVFEAIFQVDVPEDGIAFDRSTLRVESVREEAQYQGVRLTVNAVLGAARIPVQVDIGFGDHVHPRPTRAVFPPLLPDLPEARLLMYPPETVIAEKFEAMLRFGLSNSRIKDFYDIWLTIQTFDLQLPDVVEAVRGTLLQRQTPFPTDRPDGLTAAYVASVNDMGLWTGFLRRTPPTLTPPDFPELQAMLRRFFAPVISALPAPESAHGRWDRHRRAWSRDRA
ncbi:MAG TPA: nucleotidyl transferase AbiEii/AbiGii toxin family protein [Xanthomonadales bacterium]|nr:nucleotidyl transferase AbiEii/AbiGii toxin family protein [Xanthomonadales bacterium]